MAKKRIINRLKISSRLMKKKRRSGMTGAKHCRFCASSEQANAMDYKNAPLLKHFLTERGKILAARISGTCSSHQRAVSNEIKKSRVMALIPYCSGHSI